jgi:pimeloyl-ACP methyl ester carboxylesterase/DNA-binding CsgD family transcriptional regulator
MPVSHVQTEWDGKASREYLRRLAAGRQLVRYDCRGAGLSDREVSDFTVEAHVRDLKAVVDQLQFNRFALLALAHAGPTAIAFAAQYPQRVSHLILWCSYANATDYSAAPRVEAARSLIDQDWELYTQSEGSRFTEWQGGEDAGWYTAYLRSSSTPEGLRRLFAGIRATDVTELLPNVCAPTLVMHRRAFVPLSVNTARDLTSRIPNARLQLFDGPWIAPFLGGSTESVVSTLESFTGEPEAAMPPAGSESVMAVALTPRETEVLHLIAAGRTSSEISEELTLSIRTVGRHITNIYSKIGARTRADATAYAIRHDLA